MTPKQLFESKWFDKYTKWITKDSNGFVEGWTIKPLAKHPRWVNEEISIPIHITLEWESDDWTKCIYERENSMIGMCGYYYDRVKSCKQIGILKEVFPETQAPFKIVNGGEWKVFEPLTAEDLRMIKKANGIKETI